MRVSISIVAGLIILLFSSFLLPASAMVAGNARVNETLIISGIPARTDVFFIMNDGVPIFARPRTDGTVRYLPLVQGTLEINVMQDGNVIDNKTLSVGPAIVTTPPPSVGGSGGSSGGTYPTVTQAPKNQTNQTNETESIPPEETTVEPTVTVIVPDKTVEKVEKPTPVPTEAPGFGIVVAIGMVSAIYILRRNKIGKQ